MWRSFCPEKEKQSNPYICVFIYTSFEFATIHLSFCLSLKDMQRWPRNWIRRQYLITGLARFQVCVEVSAVAQKDLFRVILGLPWDVQGLPQIEVFLKLQWLENIGNSSNQRHGCWNDSAQMLIFLKILYWVLRFNLCQKCFNVCTYHTYICV